MDEKDKTSDGTSPGGIGGLSVVDSRTPGQDLRLLKRATRWPVRNSLRKLIMDKMKDILEDAESSDKSKIGASKVILAADAVNVQREKMEQDVERTKNPASLIMPVTVVEIVKPAERNGVITIDHDGPNGDR